MDVPLRCVGSADRKKRFNTMLEKLSASPDRIEHFVHILRVLGDPTRLRLLGVLQGGEANVTALCERLDLPQPTVSHHLGLLRHAKLVSNRRSGKQVFYALNDSVVSNLDEHGGIRIATGAVDLHLSSVPELNETPADDQIRNPAVDAVIETIRDGQQVRAE